MNIRNAVLGVCGACALGMSAASNAFTITSGDYTISFNGFSSGSLYSSTVACTSAADCDLPANVTSPAAGAIGSEDAWGILSVTAITNDTTNEVLFSSGGADGFLTGMFYGLTDIAVEADTLGSGTVITEFFSTGGVVEIFASATNYDPSQGVAGRNALDEYSGIPNDPGALFLRGEFLPGFFGAQPTATYSSTLTDPLAGAATAVASGFLDWTDGSALGNFDTGAFAGGADAFFNSTFNDTAGTAGLFDWTVQGGGLVTASAVPLPGTLALFGISLVAFGAARRRNAAA